MENIDIEKIIKSGKPISTEEAMKDIIPVEWSDEVLSGIYRSRTLVTNPLDVVIDGTDCSVGGKIEFRSLDVEKILKIGKPISSEEAMKGIIPVDWNDEVLSCAYRSRTLITSNETCLDKQIQNEEGKRHRLVR